MAGLELQMESLAIVSGGGGPQHAEGLVVGEAMKAAVPTAAHGPKDREAGSEQPASREADNGRESKPKYCKSSFEFGELLGEGSYSQVRKARYLHNGDVCAIKVCSPCSASPCKEREMKMSQDQAACDCAAGRYRSSS